MEWLHHRTGVPDLPRAGLALSLVRVGKPERDRGLRAVRRGVEGGSLFVVPQQSDHLAA